jgi:hypothetical protein
VLAPSLSAPPFPNRRPTIAVPKAIRVAVQMGALLGFAASGIFFLGMTIAAPIALPIVERSAGSVSSSAIAFAAHVGSAWWVFATGAVVSFVGAAATIGALLQNLVPESEG